MAYFVMEAYPTQKFTKTIGDRVSETIGSSTAQEAKERIMKALSPEQIEKKRLDLLTKNFTAAELKLMAELASTEDGKNLLQKLPNYEQDFVDYFIPYIAAAMTHAEKAKPLDKAN